MGYSNYIPLKNFSLKYKYFCYFDIRDYVSDNLFAKNNVSVKYEKEACRSDSDFIIVFCKVKKYEVGSFLNSLFELNNKMLLLGYSEYQNFCKNIYETIMENLAVGC